MKEIDSEWRKDAPVLWEFPGTASGREIPEHARVHYNLSDGSRLMIYFEGDSISVRTYGRLNIQPIAANAVSIGVVE